MAFSQSCFSAWVFGLVLLCGCQSQKESEQPQSQFIVRAYSSGAAHSTGLQVFRRSKPLFGTFVSITVYGPSSLSSYEAIEAAFGAFEEAESRMSIQQENSEISLLNQRAANEQVPVSPELFQVLFKAQEISRLTEGAFDVTIGPLTHLWGFIDKRYHLPTQAEINQVLPLIGYQQLQLLPNGMVHFQRPGMFLNLGGISKGVAVDLAIELLKERGIHSAMVKAGNDIKVYGSPPQQQGWVVQLEAPTGQESQETILLKDAALSTSGNFENFFIVDNKVYSDIIHPKTGMPVEGIAACTVIAKTCAESDAWASAFICYGVDKSIEKFSSIFPMRFTLMPKSRGGKFKVRASSNFPEVL